MRIFPLAALLVFFPLVFLPFVFFPLDAAADTNVTTATMSLDFNDQGSLVGANVCYPACGAEGATALKLSGTTDGLIRFTAGDAMGWVQRKGIADESVSGIQQLHFSGPGGESVSWRIPDKGYRITVETSGTTQLAMTAGPGFVPREVAGFGGWLETVRYLALGQHGVSQIPLDDPEVSEITTDWAGFRSRFWAVLASGPLEGTIRLQTGAGNRDAALTRDHPPEAQQFAFYIGPIEPAELAAVDQILPQAMYAGLWFWLRWISIALQHLLGWIHGFIPVWGLAIMALSVAVHILMLPLSRIADRLQQEVNATEARLAPEISRIKKELKGEQQAESILALYKQEKVHPLYSLKSMLGVAVVIPIFIGAFDMLAENIHLLETGFLWIKDLSTPDAVAQLPFSVPFFGSDLNLLPFLMTGLSVLASLLHNPLALNAELRARQVRNMVLLALAFFVLFYTFPAGMVLYWTTNNLISVTKSAWARFVAK